MAFVFHTATGRELSNFILESSAESLISHKGFKTETQYSFNPYCALICCTSRRRCVLAASVKYMRPIFVSVVGGTAFTILFTKQHEANEKNAKFSALKLGAWATNRTQKLTETFFNLADPLPAHQGRREAFDTKQAEEQWK